MLKNIENYYNTKKVIKFEDIKNIYYSNLAIVHKTDKLGNPIL
jgi:hypothetical protein